MNPNGVGLGLNIASSLVNLLAPKSQRGISVTSIPNQDSTFSFMIENKEEEGLDDLDKTILSIEIAGESPGVILPVFLPKRQNDNLSTISMLPLAARTFESEDAVIKGSCSRLKVLIADDS